MEKTKVTVIVPAYNAERYILDCVGSILDQTHGNIEVIVVDDGSTDKTADILKCIAERDSRLRIIHKENGGVSAARNSALDAASGEYIVFVDADDRVAEDHIEYMLELIDRTGADFCLSVNCYTLEKEKQTEIDVCESISSDDAVALLLSPRVTVGCWNKIYKKAFLDENKLRFRDDLFYGEGLLFIVTAAQKSALVGIGKKKTYYYRRNNESSATTRFGIEKMYSGERALDLIEKSLCTIDKKVNSMLLLHRSMYALGALTRLCASGSKDEYIDDYKRWLKYIRHNICRLSVDGNVTLYRKAMIFGGCVSPRLMMKLDIARRKRIAEKSIR